MYRNSNSPVIYVKGCDFYWLYERKNGVRGARINGVNYDMTEYFIVANREPEIHNFFMGSKVGCFGFI